MAIGFASASACGISCARAASVSVAHLRLRLVDRLLRRGARLVGDLALVRGGLGADLAALARSRDRARAASCFS